MLTCQDCNTPLTYKGRGRKPKRCPACKRASKAAKQRAYMERCKRPRAGDAHPAETASNLIGRLQPLSDVSPYMQILKCGRCGITRKGGLAAWHSDEAHSKAYLICESCFYQTENKRPEHTNPEERVGPPVFRDGEFESD